MPGEKETAPKPGWYLFGALMFVLFLPAMVSTPSWATHATPGSATVATGTPACGAAWRGVSIPPLPGNSELDGVASISATDVWTVGSYGNGTLTQTLTMHWDGSAWSIVPSPNVAGTNSRLSAVAAPGGYPATNGVWAVGDSGPAGAAHTLIEHWDGSAWSIVPSPNAGSTGTNKLDGVAFAGDNDVWAVGYYGSSPGYLTLTIHWDGSAWSIVTSPNESAGDNLLHGVTATSPADVWAVGTHYQTNISRLRTTTMHWDGSNWTPLIASPSYGNNYFFGVFSISQNDVWAVGGEEDMVEHWNGTSWGGPGPVVPGDLHGVSASAHDDVWAVGDITANGYSPVYHYDGSIWLPYPSNSGVYLQAVTSVSRGDVWAAGYDVTGQALIERYSDPCASPTSTVPVGPTNTIAPTGTHVSSATSTPTRTPTPAAINTATSTRTATAEPTSIPTAASTATSTATSVVGTGTVVATATAAATSTPAPTTCAIAFQDVPSDSTFYPYVRCLACRGIITGYPCGNPEPCVPPGNFPLLRPNNPVTRGQMAKIVSQAAAFNDAVGGQSFEDVPPGSTFYTYTERLVSRGVMSGYQCGNPEPCVPPGNRPYFRPSANVTRGQTSKIVAIARGLPAPPSGKQTFQDVPEGSTFWTWIEELAATGATGGYPCGGAEEPCVPPGNRPYFRPGKTLTRGQASRIVAVTFFADCP